MTIYHYDAVIVGAGVAGLSMTTALADEGWKVALIDKNRFPRHKVCGEFLSPESRGFLADLGLYQVVAELCPSEMDKVRLTSLDGTSLDIPLTGTALGISRYALENALLQHIQKKGVAVHTGAKVTRVDPVEQGYQVGVRNKFGQQTLVTRAVIGAWGRTPQTILGSSLRLKPRKSWIGVKSHFVGMSTDSAVELHFFPGGYLGVSPIEKGRYNVSAVISHKTFRHAGRTVMDAIKLAAKTNPNIAHVLGHALPIPGTQAAVTKVAPRHNVVAWGLVPHIGDAAAVIPPLCGDGMAMAIRSAALCAHLTDRFLRGEISLNDWRLQYTAMLHREFARPLRWGKVVEKSLTSATLATLLLRLGKFTPKLANRVVRETRLAGLNSSFNRDIRLKYE